jgi:hypothetical protein
MGNDVHVRHAIPFLPLFLAPADTFSHRGMALPFANRPNLVKNSTDNTVALWLSMGKSEISRFVYQNYNVRQVHVLCRIIFDNCCMTFLPTHKNLSSIQQATRQLRGYMCKKNEFCGHIRASGGRVKMATTYRCSDYGRLYALLMIEIQSLNSIRSRNSVQIVCSSCVRARLPVALPKVR